MVLNSMSILSEWIIIGEFGRGRSRKKLWDKASKTLEIFIGSWCEVRVKSYEV